tara:strand:+ start:279 stop:593 length:315 start_codon:yes stop_codon:yes gene_type:complete
MPTSKTIYEAFDGKEFPSEKEAEDYEKEVKERGVALRELFFEGEYYNFLDLVDKRMLDFIKSYSDDEAYILMKSLFGISGVFANKDLQSGEEWLEEGRRSGNKI